MAGEIYTWDQLVSRRRLLGWSAAGLAGLAAGDTLLAAARRKGALTAAAASPGSAAAGAGAAAAGTREVNTLCEMCVWRCGVKARVVDGVVRKLEGNPEHPNSRGKLCPRGNAGIALLYDPDRLKFPLMRVGERGSGVWRRASWDEALDYVADQMLRIKEQYGPEAMVIGSTHNLSQPYFENLLKAYGTPNYGTQRSLCFNAMTVAFLYTYGLAQPGTDYARCRYMILSGRNLAEAISNSETQDFIDMVARGAHVVVLDPRFTKSAAKASEWLPIRPGTDLAFYLAMAHVMVKEGMYDREFVEAHTVGFEAFAKEVERFSPEWAEVQTEIPAAAIRRIAREFAEAAPAAIVHPNWRTSNFLNSFQTERAIAILNALAGNWGAPGGLIPADPEESGPRLGTRPQPPYPPVRALRLDGVPWKHPLVPLKYGIYQNIRDAILTGAPYQARGWLISRQNPLLALPERRKTVEALMKLEFVGVIDVYPNDTAYFADVILPESSYLERYDPLTTAGNRIFIRQPVIPPLYDTKSTLMIFKELGERLGLGEYFPYRDEEELLAAQLAPYPISLGELKERGFYEVPPEMLPGEEGAEHGGGGQHGSAGAAGEGGEGSGGRRGLRFNTPSGKVEILSSTLKQVGAQAVPTWEAPPRPPEGQFYLLSGKVAYHSQMGTQNNPWLHDLFPENRAWIHTSVARRLGIGDGEVVVVESPAGKVKVRAQVTEGIRPDCVFMAAGFGHVSKGLTRAYGKGASDSALHLTFTDPVSGSQALSQTFVTVRKA